MRYRRVSYRYAFVLTPAESRLPSGLQRGVQLAQTTWQPSADVYETRTAVNVTVDLAGINPDEVDVLLFDDAVVVEGQRRLPPEEAPGVYHAVQIRQGPFRLEVRLPATIDAEQVQARYEQGLLRLALPKASGE